MNSSVRADNGVDSVDNLQVASRGTIAVRCCIDVVHSQPRTETLELMQRLGGFCLEGICR